MESIWGDGTHKFQAHTSKYTPWRERGGSVSHAGRRDDQRLHVKHDAIQYLLPRYIEHGSQRHYRCQHEVQPGRPLAGIIDRIRERAGYTLEYKEETHGNRQNDLAGDQNPLAIQRSKQARVGVDECRQEKGCELR